MGRCALFPLPTFDARIAAAFANATAGRVYGGSGDSTTNCSRAMEATLIGAFGPVVETEHADLMIMDPSRPFSPIEALERLGIGEAVDSPRAGCWHVAQGWRVLTAEGWVPEDVYPNGHTWIWYEPASPIPERGVRFEANIRRPWVYPQAWEEAIKPYRAGVELAVLLAG